MCAPTLPLIYYARNECQREMSGHRFVVLSHAITVCSAIETACDRGRNRTIQIYEVMT